MTPKIADVVEAKANVARARAQLTDTLGQLQERAAPKALAQDAARHLTLKGRELAEEGVAGVQRHPIALGGIVAGIALFLSRRLLLKAMTKATDAIPESLIPEQAPRKGRGKVLANTPPRPRAKRNSQ